MSASRPALLLALLAFAAPAAALAESAERQIGSWTLRCEADPITDKSRCQLLQVLAGPAQAALVIEDTLAGPTLSVLAIGAGLKRGPALIRVGRIPAMALPPCRSIPGRGISCAPEDARQLQAVEWLRHGGPVVVRLEGATGAVDLTGEVAGTDAAIEAYRRLDRASGRILDPGPTHAYARARNEEEFARISSASAATCAGDARCTRMVERCRIEAGKTAAALEACLARGASDAD